MSSKLKKVSFDAESLVKWFKIERRDLPWRENPSPYAVWVSEVMLQQTQVSVVIPYFLRWMERFPTIGALAGADENEVIKLWEGLGYYSRARNLHSGAKYVVEHFNGKLPSSSEDLAKIRGLGPYTIGAIQSFAFHQPVEAVDGNVMRVLTRYFAITDDIAKTSTVKNLRLIAKSILPSKENWIFSEGLIELGALICTKNPQCGRCPLKHSCKAYLEGSVNKFPVKSSKVKTEKLYRAVAIVEWKDSILLSKGIKGKVMQDLYEFPYFELHEENLDLSNFRKKISETWNIDLKHRYQFPKVAHSFTRYRVHLEPHFFESHKKILLEGMEWVQISEVDKLPFSSGHRRVLQHFITYKGTHAHSSR